MPKAPPPIERNTAASAMTRHAVTAPSPGSNVRLSGAWQVQIDRIEADPKQPRQEFDEASIEELAGSITEFGVLLPLLVVPIDEDKYRLISGERRLRAAKRAGLETVPVIIKEDLTPEDRHRIALAENIHRDPLGLMDEAVAIKAEYDRVKSLRAVAQAIHKSPAYVLKRLRLLEIKDETVLQEYLTGKRNLETLVEAQPDPTPPAAPSSPSSAPPTVPTDATETRKRVGRPTNVLGAFQRPLELLQSASRKAQPQQLSGEERVTLRQSVAATIADLQILMEQLGEDEPENGA